MRFFDLLWILPVMMSINRFINWINNLIINTALITKNIFNFNNLKYIKSNLRSYKSFIQKLNTRILKNLVYRPKKTATVISSFEITTGEYTRLKQQFNVTGRYLNNAEFNNFFQLISKRYDNPTDYCSYQREQFPLFENNGKN